MTQLHKAAVVRLVRLILVWAMVLAYVGGTVYAAQVKTVYNIKAGASTVVVESFSDQSAEDAIQQALQQAGVDVRPTDTVEVTTQASKVAASTEESTAPEAENAFSSPAPTESKPASQPAAVPESGAVSDNEVISGSRNGPNAESSASTSAASSVETVSAVELSASAEPAADPGTSAEPQAAESSSDAAKAVTEDSSAAASAKADSSSKDSASAEKTGSASVEDSSGSAEPAASSDAAAGTDAASSAKDAPETDPADSGSASSAAAESSEPAGETETVINIVVTHPKYVTVTVDKTLTTVQVQEGDTVQDIIDRLNIKLGENDLVSQSLDAEPDASQPITINRVQLSYFDKVKTKPFETVRKADPHSYLGTEYVKREGVPYKKVDTYEKKIIDGGEPIITKVKTKITKAKSEIICYGTKVDSPSPSGLSASHNVITNRDEEKHTITLSDGSTYSYSSISDSFAATAYCGGGTTSTGRAAQIGVVAVDPSVIPYGTRMYITSGSIVYGVCVAGDTGVHGHLIDLYFNTESHCRSFGRRGITVYFLD